MISILLKFLFSSPVFFLHLLVAGQSSLAQNPLICILSPGQPSDWPVYLIEEMKRVGMCFTTHFYAPPPSPLEGSASVETDPNFQYCYKTREGNFFLVNCGGKTLRVRIRN